MSIVAPLAMSKTVASMLQHSTHTHSRCASVSIRKKARLDWRQTTYLWIVKLLMKIGCPFYAAVWQRRSSRTRIQGACESCSPAL